MKTYLVYPVILCIALCITTSCKQGEPSGDQRTEVVNLVDKGIAHFNEVGTAAFADFSDPDNSDFVDDEYYIYVIEREDPMNIVAHIREEMIGQSIMDQVEAQTNYPFGRSIVDTALENPEGAWVPEYQFYNPSTKTSGTKHSYVKIHGNYIFGSGYYIEE